MPVPDRADHPWSQTCVCWNGGQHSSLLLITALFGNCQIVQPRGQCKLMLASHLQTDLLAVLQVPRCLADCSFRHQPHR